MLRCRAVLLTILNITVTYYYNSVHVQAKFYYQIFVNYNIIMIFFHPRPTPDTVGITVLLHASPSVSILPPQIFMWR